MEIITNYHSWSWNVFGSPTSFLLVIDKWGVISWGDSSGLTPPPPIRPSPRAQRAWVSVLLVSLQISGCSQQPGEWPRKEGRKEGVAESIFRRQLEPWDSCTLARTVVWSVSAPGRTGSELCLWFNEPIGLGLMHWTYQSEDAAILTQGKY